MISANYVSISSEGFVYNQCFKNQYLKIHTTPIEQLLSENCTIESGTTVLDVFRVFETHPFLSKLFDLSMLLPTQDFAILPYVTKFLTVKWDASFHRTQNILDVEADIVLKEFEGHTPVFDYSSPEELLSFSISTDPTFILVGGMGYSEPTRLLFGRKEFKVFEVLNVVYKQLICEVDNNIRR